MHRLRISDLSFDKNEIYSCSPRFTPINDFEIYSLNQFTNFDDINELTQRANYCTHVSIDTESNQWTFCPALIQIELINSDKSTVILLQVQHLPEEKKSSKFVSIQKCLNQILHPSKTLLGWGDLKQELIDFVRFDLFDAQLLETLTFINVQREYTLWFRLRNFMDRRGYRKWSLQDTILHLFDQFLDKSETLNQWSRPLFQQGTHLPLDPKTRSMIDYAANDCLALTKIAHHIQLWWIEKLTWIEMMHIFLFLFDFFSVQSSNNRIKNSAFLHLHFFFFHRLNSLV